MEASTCYECNQEILDYHLMTVYPDMSYHEGCLKCSMCGKPFDETKTCYLRAGKILCELDFIKMFSKCSICDINFQPNDFVIRSTDHIFHMDCFQCFTCDDQIQENENYSYKDKKLFCEEHHKNSPTSSSSPHKPTRQRTVYTESQLYILRTYYMHNPRPDASAKDYLVKLTGLAPKKIRIWFQNQRCKDKITNVRAHKT